MFLLKKVNYLPNNGKFEMPMDFDFSKWRNFNEKTKIVLFEISQLQKGSKLKDIQGIYVAVRSSDSPDYDSLYENNELQIDKVSPNIFLKKINASLASNIATYLNVCGPTYTLMDPRNKVEQVFRQSLLDSIDFEIHKSLVIIEDKKLNFLFYVMENTVEQKHIKDKLDKCMEIFNEDRK